jgi:hypothetical protein
VDKEQTVIDTVKAQHEDATSSTAAARKRGRACKRVDATAPALCTALSIGGDSAPFETPARCREGICKLVRQFQQLLFSSSSINRILPAMWIEANQAIG